MRAKPPELLTCVGSPVKNRRLASRQSRRLICSCSRPLTCKDNDAKEAQERLIKQWKKILGSISASDQPSKASRGLSALVPDVSGCHV